MSREQVLALFLLAGIEVLDAKELANQYWPRVPDYAVLIMESPWWLVRTNVGCIVIGWRKRVISIEWKDTPIRKVLTERSVTKDDTMIHAYGYVEALEYLTAFASEMKRAAAPESRTGEG